jgi:hypothetical protein
LRHFHQRLQAQFQPIRERVQAAIEARDTQRVTQIAQLAQHQQGPLVMILKVARGDDGDGQHFGVTPVRQFMRAASATSTKFVEDDKDRYNPFCVHRFLLKLWFVSPTFSGSELMGAN